MRGWGLFGELARNRGEATQSRPRESTGYRTPSFDGPGMVDIGSISCGGVSHVPQLAPSSPTWLLRRFSIIHDAAWSESLVDCPAMKEIAGPTIRYNGSIRIRTVAN